MKLPQLFFTLASVLGSCGSVSAAQDTQPVADFLHAIRLVETGDNYNAPPGRLGEQGPYQFRREVWRRYTHAPFAQARTTFADRIAAQHYVWLREELAEAGVTPSTWNIAAAWNSGIGAVRSGRIPRATRDYANRVRNIMREDAREEAAMRLAFTPHFHIAVASTLPARPLIVAAAP
jgi:hypothetical protein